MALSFSGCFESNQKLWGDAPDFTLKTVYGNNFTLSDNFGKVILIDLMALWCGPCHYQMPEIAAVIDELGDEIVVVSVDIELTETSQQVISTYSDYVDKWTFVMDDYYENIAGKYEVVGIPKLIIIDKDGNIYYTESGLTSSSVILNLIEKVL